MPFLRASPGMKPPTTLVVGALAASLAGIIFTGKFHEPVVPARADGAAFHLAHATAAGLPGKPNDPVTRDASKGLLADEDPAQALEALAMQDPAKAMALACRFSDDDLRQQMIEAALRGWARVAPDAAADWCLQRSISERAADAAAVLAGVAANPDRALELAARFVRDDPALAHDHGCSLVYTLAQAGEFSLAAHFAVTGSDTNHEAWITTAFTLWAEHQPENAMAAVASLPISPSRTGAFEAAVAGWAETDPAGLAQFASRQASGPDRLYALHSAVGAWGNRDPIGASEWLCHCPPGIEFDLGAATVATAAPLVTLWPELALNWAGTVTDTGLRSGTIAVIVHEWAKHAPAEARHYAEISPDLLAADRTALMTDFTVAPGT